LTGRTLEETAALFDGEPVELIEAAGEAATQHTVRYFVGRDTRDLRVDTDSEEGSKRLPSGERKDADIELYEDIEMSRVAYSPAHSRDAHTIDGDPDMSTVHGALRGTDRSSVYTRESV
jgi:hypothetical protein